MISDPGSSAIRSAIRLFESLSGEIDPAALQRKFLLSLLELQNVSRGSIWIKKGNRYHCIEAVGVESEKIKGAAIDENQPSIVGWVIENGKMTVADPTTDERHFRQMEQQLIVKSSLILCFPLFLRNRTVYGAIQIIDTSPEKRQVNLDESLLAQIQDLVNIGSIALANAVFYNDQLKEAQLLKQTLNQIRSEGVIIGQSREFLSAMERIRSYAVTDYPVLITGESGTGKELAATRIHELSNRRDKPFVVQNCSAIPETLLESELFGYRKGAFSGAMEDKVGLFEAANGGTVFLDEIGDMPMGLQARILRVIQNGEIKPLGQIRVKKVDIRVISATNKDIKHAASRGEFRQDLFYRLSVLPLHLPPLRERKEDISLLYQHFIKRDAWRMGLNVKKASLESMMRLIHHRWTGNIRELENLVRYLLVTVDGDVIEPSDLPFFFEDDPSVPSSPRGRGAIPANPDLAAAHPFEGMSWEHVETAYAHFLLSRYDGNVSRAARAAGLNRSTFASRLHRLGIQR